MNISQIGERLRQARTEKGLTLQYIADLVGVARSTVYRYEVGQIENIKLPVIDAIARAVGVSTSWLLGEYRDKNDHEFLPSRDVTTVKSFHDFPVIGSIAAGYDSLVTEEFTGEHLSIPAHMLKGRSPADFFVLRVSGNSMYPEIKDGDNVLVLRSTSVDSGSIAVILYDGEEATLKRVRYVSGENWLELIPINPEYVTKRISGADLESCRVLGKVIMLMRDF